jgi:hypothetical protein
MKKILQALADTRRPPSARRTGSTSPRVFATISGSPAVAANAQWQCERTSLEIDRGSDVSMG